MQDIQHGAARKQPNNDNLIQDKKTWSELIQQKTEIKPSKRTALQQQRVTLYHEPQNGMGNKNSNSFSGDMNYQIVNL